MSFAAAKALWALKETDGRDTLLAILAGNMKTSSGFITKQMRDSSACCTRRTPCSSSP